MNIENLTPKQKKLFLIEKAEQLCYDDRLQLLSVLNQDADGSQFIVENGDGCRIDLDKLSINLINKLYHIVNIKLETKNINENE